MATRKLTGSEVRLSEIGLGCATLAFDATPTALADSRDMLTAAYKAGIRYFDTAPFYGRGLSERLVGDALLGRDYILSSKVGRILDPEVSAPTHMPFNVTFDYSYDGIMRSVEDSFQRLGLCKIDILYAHDLGNHTHGDDADKHFRDFFEGGYRALSELRATGVVEAIGLGVNEVEVCEQAMKHGDFDLFLLAGRYTLLERTDALEFFDACADANTDIVIGGPFNSGLLVGGGTYNYRAIPDDIALRHRILLDYCRAQEVDIGAAALQFPLRHSVVKSVIPGPKNTTEFQQIQRWKDIEIPDQFWAGLKDLSQ
ncbi:aldo/keto reductase [Tateyamaria sp.]|uniref:aldo/keto reductase n=1 Tax=Tateyamaria sp. TaxID=1929288 RepID=UPI00329C0413